MTILYSDNFDADTTGSLPTGWTTVSGTWAVGTTQPISGAKTLSCTSNTNGSIVLYTAAGYTQTNQRTSVDFLYDVNTVRSRPAPMARVTGTSLVGGYTVLIGAQGSEGNVGIYKCVNGTFSSLAFGAHGQTLVAGTTKLTIEINCVGTTIEARVYPQGGTRPATAQVSVTDSTSSAGTSGLYNSWTTPSTQGGFDNFVWDDTTTAATAITLSGPSSGNSGVASTVFTVGANGGISGTVVVTPSDSSGGGTFSPTTVSINTASPTGTFTYTPASAGAKTISVTNNGSLTNPSNITYTSVASTVVPVDNANIDWSPGNWDTLLVGDFGVSVKSMQTTACGAYLKFSATGTTAISLSLDSTTLSGFGTNAPYVMWSIGDGAMQYALLTPGSVSLPLATGLTTGTTYSVQVYLRGSVETQGDRWGSSGVSPTNVFRVQGVVIDGGGSLSAYPLLGTKRMLCFGDSRTEGINAAGTTTKPQDHARSWAWFTGRALGAEVGVIGYGATGWAQAGNGGMPSFPTSFPYCSVGRARSFANVDYVFVMHGFNDVKNGISSATITAAVQAWISAARTACGANTWIFVVSDPSGIAAVPAGVTAYQSANPTDGKVAFIDTGDTIETAPFSGPISTSTPTWGSVDKCHMLEFAQGMFGSSIARKAQAAVDTASSSAITQGLGLGGLGLTASGRLVAVL